MSATDLEVGPLVIEVCNAEVLVLYFGTSYLGVAPLNVENERQALLALSR